MLALHLTSHVYFNFHVTVYNMYIWVFSSIIMKNLHVVLHPFFASKHFFTKFTFEDLFSLRAMNFFQVFGQSFCISE